MSARAAFVLGLCAIAAAVLHGGIWTAGHDFIVNRFTGAYVFVPSDDAGEGDVHVPARAALTTFRADGRVAPSLPRR